MSGLIAPFPKHQVLANDGTPAAGYQLFTYTSGTGTKIPTYTDAGLTASNTNPIILDASGRATIFLDGSLVYTLLLASPTDSDPPVAPIWSVDGIQSVATAASNVDIIGTVGEAIAIGEVTYLADGSYAGLSSGTTAGRWYLGSADAATSSSLVKAAGIATTGNSSGLEISVRIVGRVTGLTGLVAGTVYYFFNPGMLTATPPAFPRQLGVADSTTSLVLGHNLLPLDQLWVNTTTVGNVGSGEDTLMSYSLEPPALDRNQRGVSIEAWGHTTTNVNAKTIKLYFGATEILTHSAATSEAGSWTIRAQVSRTGAATQNAVAFSRSAPTAGGAVTASSAITTQPTETLSAAVTIKVTGTATTTNDITQEGMIVRYT